MSDWKIETRGFKELQATFRDAPRKIQDIGREWAKDVAADETKYIVRAWEQSKTRGSKRTGRFASLIHPYARAFIVGVTFGDYPKLGQKLRGWIINGTPPHIIMAKRAGALHFVWKGKERFFKFVHHPGTAPNDFVTKGATKFDARVQFWLRDLEKRVVKTLGG